MTASARQFRRSLEQRVPHLPKPAADPQSCRSRTCNCRGGQRLCPAPKSKTAEEAATPEQPVRAVARLWKFPPAIRSRESPAPAGSAAIIRPSQKLSRFAAPTFRHFVAPGNIKNASNCAEPVDVETSLWKP
jgi:hypothetical protein